jgi:hypothetical protein
MRGELTNLPVFAGLEPGVPIKFHRDNIIDLEYGDEAEEAA